VRPRTTNSPWLKWTVEDEQPGTDRQQGLELERVFCDAWLRAYSEPIDRGYCHGVDRDASG
jgi:hypothetical protein